MGRFRCSSCLVVIPMAFSADATLGRSLSFQSLVGYSNPVDNVYPYQTTPSFDGSTLAFSGVDLQTGFEGIYTLPLAGQHVTPVAKRNEAAPGGGTYTQLLSGPSISNGYVAFHAFTSFGRGIYSNVGGTPRNVAGPGFTSFPGGGGSSTWAMNPAIEGNTVVFAPQNISGVAAGVYSWTQASGIQLVVNASTPNPENPSQPMGAYGARPGISGGRIVMTTGGIPQAVRTVGPQGQNFQTVVVEGTPLPGGGGSFANFDGRYIDMDGNTVVFSGGPGGGSNGLYTNLGGSIHLVAKDTTPIPGGTGDFTGFDDLGVSGSNIVFVGYGSGTQKGIFGDFGRGLEKVIAVGDIVDGKVVDDLWFGRDGLVGNRLVFTALFTTDIAILTTTVPAPSAGAVCVLALSATICRRRRSNGSHL